MTNDWHVGDARIQRIEECQLPSDTADWLLPGLWDRVATNEIGRNDHLDGNGALSAATQSFAVTTHGQKVLVDTGIGNAKPRANPAWDHLDTDFMERLSLAGYPAEEVDFVVLTHLHADHVGWNTRWDGDRWVPTFPNARYIMNSTEREYWSRAEMEESRAIMIADSIVPIEDAGLLETPLVGPQGFEVTPGVRLLPTPGHTPGHIAVLIESEGAQALITGDVLHHPTQAMFPFVGSSVDVDSALAAQTREETLRWAAQEEILLLGSHFTDPTGGWIGQDGDAYRFTPAHAAH